jgi:HD superfamily phosphohydrolase
MVGQMNREVYLDLYGPIAHDSPEDDMAWDLYQTAAVARIRDISLSSTPSSFAPHGVALSRFQHSVAVGYLGRKLCDRRPTIRPYRDTLIAAGICHDLGSPPFSHIAEIFMHALTGKTHEEQTKIVLAKGGEVAKLLEKYGVEPAEVVGLINGSPDHPLSALVAGSIDLDNISNSQDLLRSLGYRDELFYHPLKLIEAFRFRDGKLLLDSGYLKELLGWAEARRKLYDLLYAEPNLSAATMLYRALEFAFAEGTIKEDFFKLGESDALHFLRYDAGKEAQKLLLREWQWQHYPRLYEQLNPEEDMRIVSLYDDWRLRKDFTDRVAKDLKVPLDEIALYAGRDRGEKAITLPFIGERVEAATELFSGRQGQQRLALFAHKRHLERLAQDRVTEIIENAVAELPEAEEVGHVFC